MNCYVDMTLHLISLNIHCWKLLGNGSVRMSVV